MFSGKFNSYKPFSRLINKNRLQTLDIIYNGQPFVNVVSSNQNTFNLDTVYNGQPFLGIPNNYIRRSISSTNHPDVNTWLNTLSLSGGTANSTTISALNTFCNSIDSAGLRRKFYRLNLFCGNNLNACLVPLYVSSWWNDPVYGFSIDQNLGFLTSDYTETGVNGGLLGDGASKHLRTGLRPDRLPTGFEYNCHLSAYRRTFGNTQALIGSYYYDNNISANRHSYEISQSTINLNTTGGPAVPTINSYPVFQIGVRSSPSNAIAYNNSTAGTPYTTTISAFATNIPFVIFGRNLIAGSPPIEGAYTVTFLTSALLAGYSIGASLNSSEVTSFNTIMQTFQTSLNRNV